MNLVSGESRGCFLAEQFGNRLVAVADVAQILCKQVEQGLVGTLRGIV